MPEFLVETYLGRDADVTAAAALAGAAAREMTRRGTRVTHLRSTHIGEDEICLHWFDAPSLDAVRDTARRASLECDRILAADTAEQRGDE